MSLFGNNALGLKGKISPRLERALTLKRMTHPHEDFGDGDLEDAPAPTEQERRCEVCGWSLAASRDEGCVEGDCSYRPFPGGTEWLRIQSRRAALNQAALNRKE